MMMLRASIPAEATNEHNAMLEEFVAAAVGDDAAPAEVARAAIVDRLVLTGWSMPRR